MGFKNIGAVSFLDRIRLFEGVPKLKAFFYETGKKNRKAAIYFANDPRLSFGALFVLMPEIDLLNLYKDLNSRNTAALRVCAKILKNKKLSSSIDRICNENAEIENSVLKWMLISGKSSDGIDNQFDMVMDKIASLLIIERKDKTILPAVADMIFERNRKGLLIHDLVWAFFQSKDPFTLRLIAGYLKSNKEKDVKLASKLLNIELPESAAAAAAYEKQYSEYIAWLDENYPFLYFTGESFQQTESPVPFRIDLNAKIAKTGAGGAGDDYYRP